MLTPDGDKPIGEFNVGDPILSAPEDDPTAPLEVKIVEEVFKNKCRLLNLHVQGRVIRTTPEHPFYVSGKGWLGTKDLVEGDLLRSHDGQWLAVEAVTDSGEESEVYNLRIPDYHTYFVGARAWGFSVWAHNACDTYANLRKVYAGSGKQVHHLLEQRFATVLKMDPKTMLSAALPKHKHQVFTNAWRGQIGYGAGTKNASVQDVEKAARAVYLKYPGILRQLGL